MSDKAEAEPAAAAPTEEPKAEAAEEAPAEEKKEEPEEITPEKLKEENKQLRQEIKNLKERLEREQTNYKKAEEERVELKRVVQECMKTARTVGPEIDDKAAPGSADRGGRRRGGRGRNKQKPDAPDSPTSFVPAVSPTDEAEAEAVRSALRTADTEEQVKAAISKAKELNLKYEVKMGEKKLEKIAPPKKEE